ncbi:MAG TPA: sigma-54 dependent transcriptional regulator, partial [Pirellulales bacterium]
ELEEESLEIIAPRIARTSAGAALARPLAETSSALACGLEAQGALVGLVLLGQKEDGGAYSDEDRTFLLALARTTGLALLSAQGRHVIEQLRSDLEGKLQEIAEQRRRINVLQGELLEQERIRMSDPEPTPALLPDPRLDDLRHGLRGSSPVVRELLNSVAKIARSSSSVLIRGESGTGKELLARAIHDNSPRSDGPFVVVHCAALSQGLLESELFGHERGAFTGADRRKIGRFELADRGTLFLDEIGDVNLDTQIKLLRVLQEHTIERVGGVETIRVDVRLVAATHRNLEQLMAEGSFREDLFYRLNVISLHAPPLRERGRDVLELARHFLVDSRDRAGKAITGWSAEVEAALLAYPWPGNVRQLQNVIERAVVLAERELLQLHDLSPEIRDPALRPSPRSLAVDRLTARTSSGNAAGGNTLAGNAGSASLSDGASGLSSVGGASGASSSGTARGGNGPSRPAPRRDGRDLASPAASNSANASAGLNTGSFAAPALGDSLQELERRRLVEALASCNGNKAEAARLLGVPRSTLFSKLKKYGLD